MRNQFTISILGNCPSVNGVTTDGVSRGCTRIALIYDHAAIDDPVAETCVAHGGLQATISERMTIACARDADVAYAGDAGHRAQAAGVGVGVDYLVIHIRNSEERYANILRNQEKLKQNIHIFDAVVGKNLDLNDLKVFDDNLVLNFKYNYINEIGCYLSHFMLIKSIEKNTGYTVAFEDDFDILTDDLDNQIRDIIKKVDVDFDILFLGNLNDNHAENLIDEVYYVDKNIPLWGTQAYLINNKNAGKIYDKLLNLNEAIDNKYKALIDSGELNGLTIFPISVGQVGEKIKSQIR